MLKKSLTLMLENHMSFSWMVAMNFACTYPSAIMIVTPTATFAEFRKVNDGEKSSATPGSAKMIRFAQFAQLPSNQGSNEKTFCKHLVEHWGVSLASLWA